MSSSDPEQVVVESSPYERLAYTWHGLTPELVEKMGWDEDRRLKLAGDPRTTATFTIEPQDGGVVKLSLVHTGEPGSTMVETVEQGWPSVLAGLKTLLETGSPLKP